MLTLSRKVAEKWREWCAARPWVLEMAAAVLCGGAAGAAAACCILLPVPVAKTRFQVAHPGRTPYITEITLLYCPPPFQLCLT